MRVQFFAYIRDFSGCKEGEYPNWPDVRALLNGLSKIYGVKMREALLNEDGSQANKDIIIMVNGRHICHLQDLETPLKQSDTVQVFPVVAGG